MSVRVRMAPSPTGFLHIGSTRTALYNFLFAKKMGGKFILRVEDTDKERLVEGAKEDIIEALEWLGLEIDEGPIFQSERLELYKRFAKELLDKGLAYTDAGAIRFKTNKGGKTSWHDLIGNKDITFDNSTQEDFVILKTDSYPTYNFANVVDDHLMEITHVIRGPEFISSTPKHLMLYSGFGWTAPEFAHVPAILGTDRSKLSKRHGAKPVMEFKKDGYLPEAVVNYMALLGWTPPSQKEIMSMEEMIGEFDIKDINVASPIFDITKLEWLNGEYIRKLTDEQLTDRMEQFLVDHPPKEKLSKIVPLVKDRIKKLADFIPLTDFLFEKPDYDLGEFRSSKLFESDERVKEILVKIVVVLENLPSPWTSDNFEKSFRALAQELELPAGDIFQIIRITVSGQHVTPPLFESIQILGEEETLDRIRFFAKNYPDFPDYSPDLKMTTESSS